MTNITKYLPDESKTVTTIFNHYEKIGNSQQSKGYLGASIIGHPCERYLWYTFRGCCQPKFSGRMYRLFETGNLEENRLERNLKSIGCEVHTRDHDMRQFAISGFGDHFSGHLDGCALGIPEAPKTWHVLEFKTHNAKSFADLVKKGVKESKPQHYSQMMIEMHYTGMTRALYLAVNKDTDDLHAERIRYNEEEAQTLTERIERIITSTLAPERIASRSDWYQCTYCDAMEICWGDLERALPIENISCRQCCHATPMPDGHARWICEKHSRSLSNHDQAKACEDHLILPDLIIFAIPDSYVSDCILFINSENNIKWIHGKADGGYSTLELTKTPRSVLGNKTIGCAKELFSAEVVNCNDDTPF